MDARRFDTLSRALNASPTRRAALRALATLGLWGAGDLLDPDAIEAGKKKGGKRGKGPKKKQPQDQSPPASPPPPPPPPPQCAAECCDGIKDCPGRDVCCNGRCRQCCPGIKDCPEAGTKCCTNGFCTTPNEQCCQDEDCPNQQLPLCCATSSGGTACSQCCPGIKDCSTNSLRPLCCERGVNGERACDQCCVDTDCPAGQRCHPLGDCVFCLAIGQNCATDFGCCSDYCDATGTGGTFGKCANRPLPGP